MTKNSTNKIVIFCLVTVVIIILVLEACLHLIYYARRGGFMWQSLETFNVREFNTPVADERYFTMKKNLRYQESAKKFTIETDDHGFRVGRHQVSSQAGNIVFIGDSVPFGWGVDGTDSVPSKLQAILAAEHKPWGIINAAIPSYSLDQAVHRYKYEIAGKFKIHAVVLQIYDPASQFAILGSQWSVENNWATFKEGMSSVQQARFLKYSALYFLYCSFYGKVEEKMDPGDQKAINNYINSIGKSLDILNTSLDDGVKEVIILSVTIPQDAFLRISTKRMTAVKILNDALMDYATKHYNDKVKYVYIDLYKTYNKEPPRKVFIDYCCHLSSYGAELEAKAIEAHLIN
jgi:hypothetical protein